MSLKLVILILHILSLKTDNRIVEITFSWHMNNIEMFENSVSYFELKDVVNYDWI